MLASAVQQVSMWSLDQTIGHAGCLVWCVQAAYRLYRGGSFLLYCLASMCSLHTLEQPCISMAQCYMQISLAAFMQNTS